ncbi:envelope stress response protein PspG [Thaumasiovibrio sp. DFM-14]|uniref:envelope stress response protein PspG n=1 Tax=Thaumasiovibrio sp. DFM-14 TaxID=3384792 RepID=UPI00399F3C1A
MVELLFVLVFAAVLVLAGVGMMSVMLALMAGFVVMMLFGMLGILFKLLPWLLVVGIVVWLVRPDPKDDVSSRRYQHRDWE